MNGADLHSCGNFRGGRPRWPNCWTGLASPLVRRWIQGELLRTSNSRSSCSGIWSRTESNGGLGIQVSRRPPAYAGNAGELQESPSCAFLCSGTLMRGGQRRQRRTGQDLHQMMVRTVEYNLRMTGLLQSLSCPTRPDSSLQQLLVRGGGGDWPAARLPESSWRCDRKRPPEEREFFLRLCEGMT